MPELPLSDKDAEKLFRWHFVERCELEHIGCRAINELSVDPAPFIIEYKDPESDETEVEIDYGHCGEVLVKGALLVRGQGVVIPHFDTAFYFVGSCPACGTTHPYISFGCDTRHTCTHCGKAVIFAPRVSEFFLDEEEEMD